MSYISQDEKNKAIKDQQKILQSIREEQGLAKAVEIASGSDTVGRSRSYASSIAGVVRSHHNTSNILTEEQQLQIVLRESKVQHAKDEEKRRALEQIKKDEIMAKRISKELNMRNSNRAPRSESEILEEVKLLSLNQYSQDKEKREKEQQIRTDELIAKSFANYQPTGRLAADAAESRLKKNGSTISARNSNKSRRSRGDNDQTSGTYEDDYSFFD